MTVRSTWFSCDSLYASTSSWDWVSVAARVHMVIVRPVVDAFGKSFRVAVGRLGSGLVVIVTAASSDHQDQRHAGGGEGCAAAHACPRSESGFHAALLTSLCAVSDNSAHDHLAATHVRMSVRTVDRTCLNATGRKCPKRIFCKPRRGAGFRQDFGRTTEW